MAVTGPSAMQHAVLEWYDQQQRDLRWRHTRDPYAILVSEVMLQQTQASISRICAIPLGY